MSHRARVIASRTVLLMLLIAALAVLGLGILVQIRGDAPEVEGWLRTLFGKVFLVVSLGMAAVLGIPAAVGLWAMAGANREDAAPALPRTARLALAGTAVATVVVTAVVCLATGSALRVLNLGLVGIVALAELGLGGAVSYSPHRWRAALSAVALVVFTLGTAWVLVNAFISPPI
jgi:hypothetical protein